MPSDPCPYPARMTMSREEAMAFLAERHWGVLATVKSSDGRPQLSNVAYALLDDRVRVSTTTDRAKARNVSRDPRASLHVTSTDFWSYVVAEGDATLSPVAATPGDATCQALLTLYEAVAGEPHPDPDEFHDEMVRQRRVELSFAVEGLYPTSD